MKDAKGHGSDPQGMHSQGVQQIDGHHRYVAYKAEKVTRVPVVIQGTK
jgi:hypothetical protein